MNRIMLSVPAASGHSSHSSLFIFNGPSPVAIIDRSVSYLKYRLGHAHIKSPESILDNLNQFDDRSPFSIFAPANSNAPGLTILCRDAKFKQSCDFPSSKGGDPTLSATKAIYLKRDIELANNLSIEVLVSYFQCITKYMDDNTFLALAYQFLLNRPIDYSGRLDKLAQRNGRSSEAWKANVLADILHCEEHKNLQLSQDHLFSTTLPLFDSIKSLDCTRQ